MNYLLFSIYPYIAAAVFFLGSLLRYDYGQYSWRAGSSQLLDKKRMRLASNLFHIGIIGIFVGHFFGMLTPYWVYESFLTLETKQLGAMVGGGTAGALALIGGSMLLWRRLTNERIKATTTVMDIVVIALLAVQALLGLMTIPFSAQHPDGSEMMKLVNWAQAVVVFDTDPSQYLNQVKDIFKLHIFLGITLFLLFPFSRLVHIWSIPAEYLIRRYQLVYRFRSRFSG
ncbi:Respiratory nitrate reductase 1 gamma chain [invertebrate metagenome]|uniref:Respiratory nitrate reductase 1 gamma chain n=1 Tax=invertebrate metagenome TaxID=1711999 RepID=A0A2H9T815_9ZZZZ